VESLEKQYVLKEYPDAELHTRSIYFPDDDEAPIYLHYIEGKFGEMLSPYCPTAEAAWYFAYLHRIGIHLHKSLVAQ
jgi:hypothetical protein